jgi:hypothetical protein
MPETILIIVYVLLGFLGLGALMLLMSLIVLLVVRVPFVRTPKRSIQALIDANIVTANDLVFDLGAGDGKFLHELVTATGCRGEGFEISPFFWFLGECRAALSRRWKMHLQNFLNVDLSEPTVIFNFLAPAGIPGLTQKLNAEVRPGQTIISYGFQIPGWTPTQIIYPNPDHPTGSKFFVYKRLDLEGQSG